jgi:polyisoprenoid-binding protein YceI
MHIFIPIIFAVYSVSLSGHHSAALSSHHKDIVHSYRLDAAHSQANFSIAHLYVIQVPGSVPIKSGSIVFAGKSITPKSISVVLDPMHIDTHDPDRNEALQGPKWFDTKHFPTWKFSSKSIKPGSHGAFTVNGLLTIHGVTQPMILNVTTTHGFPVPKFVAVGHVDRHTFGMLTTPIDGTVGSDVNISINAVLAR